MYLEMEVLELIKLHFEYEIGVTTFSHCMRTTPANARVADAIDPRRPQVYCAEDTEEPKARHVRKLSRQPRASSPAFCSPKNFGIDPDSRQCASEAPKEEMARAQPGIVRVPDDDTALLQECRALIVEYLEMLEKVWLVTPPPPPAAVSVQWQ